MEASAEGLHKRGRNNAPAVFVHNSQPAPVDPGAIRAVEVI